VPASAHIAVGLQTIVNVPTLLFFGFVVAGAWLGGPMGALVGAVIRFSFNMLVGTIVTSSRGGLLPREVRRSLAEKSLGHSPRSGRHVPAVPRLGCRSPRNPCRKCWRGWPIRRSPGLCSRGSSNCRKHVTPRCSKGYIVGAQRFLDEMAGRRDLFTAASCADRTPQIAAPALARQF
jgi:hypothetical protein